MGPGVEVGGLGQDAGIAKGGTIGGASIDDFAPTIVLYNGVDPPSESEGRPLFAINGSIV